MKYLSTSLVSIGLLIAIIICGSYAVLYYETFADNANIKTMSDALWWSLNMASVGDASLYPVTNGGRIVGAILIVLGYAVFTLNIGMISAHVAHMLKRK